MEASYSYFLLAILDLGIRLRLGHGRGICIVDAFISYLSPTRSVCEDTLVGECVSYPSPTRSVCEDTLVGVCVSVLVC